MLERKRSGIVVVGGLFCLALMNSATGLSWAQTSSDMTLDTLVVTGKIEGEERSKSPATIWVIDEEKIKKTNASSITDLLANSAAGFFSEWTPGQTSINIRGGASDGQGKDFKSQVMVLINGRRAGTANLSKLSPNEVKRVEIMRGPASVMYGSQAIGGIINIIMKDGRNTEGGQIDARVGSAGLRQTHAEYARAWGEDEAVATYLGGTWGRKNDYDGGKGAGIQINTQWQRYGGMGNVDWRINDSHDVNLMLRSDGVYDVGFRGSGANRYAKDDRTNQSLDLSWQFKPDDLPFKWNLHSYLVYDEDYFKWGSPVTGGTRKDYNKRKQYIMGLKFQPVINLHESNDLRLGVDLEHSKLRSDRDQVTTAGLVNYVLPQDLNQTEKTYALYVEDTQRLFDDRLTLRAGLRYNHGKIEMDDTQYQSRYNLKPGPAEDYDFSTWSVGVNFAATDFLSFRAGAATGFRAPTATEKSSSVITNLNGTQTAGNPDLDVESNLQYEAGLFLHGSGWYADLAVFHNEIKDRIQTQVIGQTPGGYNISRYVNNNGKIRVNGLEFDSRLRLDELLDMGDWRLSFGLSATYNFKMEDESRKTRNRDEVDRMYEYQGAFHTQIGKAGEVCNPWSVRLTGILRGPVYYDTEENLRRPAYEPVSNYVHRKSPFMVWNLSAELDLSSQWTAYAGVNNLFDKNQHPLFIAIDDGNPYLSASNDGGDGTSMPGREFYVGLRYSF